MEQRHTDEVSVLIHHATQSSHLFFQVIAAAKRAQEEYKRNHPEVDDKDLQVELPKAAPAPGAAHQHRHGVPMPMPGMGMPAMYEGLPGPGLQRLPIPAALPGQVFHGNVVIHNHRHVHQHAPGPAAPQPPGRDAHGHGVRHRHAHHVPGVLLDPIPPALPPGRQAAIARAHEIMRQARARDEQLIPGFEFAPIPLLLPLPDEPLFAPIPYHIAPRQRQHAQPPPQPQPQPANPRPRTRAATAAAAAVAAAGPAAPKPKKRRR